MSILELKVSFNTVTAFEQKHLKTSCFSLWLETVRNLVMKAIKACIIDMRITWVSNNMYPITNSSNWIPVIGHPCPNYVTNRLTEDHLQSRILLKIQKY